MSSPYCPCAEPSPHVDDKGYPVCRECGHVVAPDQITEPLVVMLRRLELLETSVKRIVAASHRSILQAISATAPAEDAAVLDAGQVAALVGRSRDWVYRHKEELGGFPATTEGLRPRVSFPRERINAYLRGQQLPMPRVPTVRSPGRPRKPSTKTKLIEYEEPR